MIGLFLGGLITVLFPLLCIVVIAENFLPFKYRRFIFVVSAMLLLTPSWAPATIVSVPIPFGMLLGLGLFSGEAHELFNLVISYGWWHCIAFSITGIFSWLVSMRLFKPEYTTNA